jgi:putative excisionase
MRKDKSWVETNTYNEILSFKQALEYLDMSKSSLYKLTSSRSITFLKPNNGKIYFRKSDLDNWLLSNVVKSINKCEREMFNQIQKNYENGRQN